MKERILLITGWGGGTQLLHALQKCLEQQIEEVALINIFNAADPQVLQQHIELAKHYDVIVGWSLGGQLAALLVDGLERHYGQHKVLISLASNPCFVVNDAWSTAMPIQTFQRFKQDFQQDAVATLKQFGYMVCQGVESTKTDWRHLQSLLQAQPIHLLQQGLELLEKLNIVDILKNYAGQQYHIFAQQDQLISYQIVLNMQQLSAKSLKVDTIRGSHGVPIFHAQLLSDKILQYLRQIKPEFE